ncbi:MAG: hypothetical protein AAF891_00010 [Pseudomonadota bacterium]
MISYSYAIGSVPTCSIGIVNPVLGISIAAGGTEPLEQRTYQGQLVSDLAEHAAITALENYDFPGGAIVSAVIQTQDGGAGPWTMRAGAYPLELGQAVRVLVSTDQATTREWVIETAVEYALQIADGPGNTLEIDRNDIVTTGVYDIDLTVADPPINETVQLDVADLVAGAVMLAVPAPTGTAAVGAVLSVQEGIAATEDAGGITGRNYLWGRFLTASQTLEDAVPISGATAATFTVRSADQGYTIVCEQTAVDAGGPGTAAISPTGVEIPAAVGAVTNTFTAADNTALQTHTPEDGFPFLPAVYSPDPSPMEILGGAVRPTAAGASSAHVQTGRALAVNSRITANVRMFGAPNGTHSQGVTLYDAANDVRYTFRFNGNNRRWQLYRFGGQPTVTIWEGEPTGTGGVDGTYIDGVVREIILEKNGDILTARINGNLVATRDISGDGFVSGRPGLQSFGATVNGARIDTMLFEVL